MTGSTRKMAALVLLQQWSLNEFFFLATHEATFWKRQVGREIVCADISGAVDTDLCYNDIGQLIPIIEQLTTANVFVLLTCSLESGFLFWCQLRPREHTPGLTTLCTFDHASNTLSFQGEGWLLMISAFPHLPVTFAIALLSTWAVTARCCSAP